MHDEFFKIPLIKLGLEQGLIGRKGDFLFYTHQGIKRNLNKPEEKVQALCYLKLILEYNYPKEHIKLFAPVKMGSSTKEADIIVFTDSTFHSPYIIVECKKQDISDLAFKQGIEQAFSYAVVEEANFVWISSSLKDEYFEVLKEKPRKRQSIPDIPKFGQNEIPSYKFVKNPSANSNFKDLETITQDALTQVFKQAHNALWGGGELHPSAAFDELDKLIFCKIWDEKHTKRNEPYKFQLYTKYKNSDIKKGLVNDELVNKELAVRIKELYLEGRDKDPEVFKEDIKLSDEKIRTVVSYLEKINLSKTDLDSKGKAFETFMGSYFRGDFGQYFTPRNIVKFIVDVLPITEHSFVLDTSCGSGGFLLHALDKVRKIADEEYPQEPSMPESAEHFALWHNFAKNNLFGIEINEQIARVAKMNMIIHDDGHTNVIGYDGLAPITKIPKPITETPEKEKQREALNKLAIDLKNPGFKENHFDFILTNPPFGSIIKQTEKAYLSNYNFGNKTSSWLDLKPYRKERENQATEVLFIEQAHSFLKERGILAIVIPDGILSNSSMQYVRDDIEELYKILAIISMPQTAFSHTGAGVKSSVMFLQKNTKERQEKIIKFKEKLQERIKANLNYIPKYEELESQKAIKIKALNKQYPSKEAKESSEYKELKNDIQSEFKDKIESLKNEALKSYQEQKSKEFELEGLEYDIFMALAENIGYDATGKETELNELDIIAEQLREFIKHNMD